MIFLLALEADLAAQVRELLPGTVAEHHGADLSGVPAADWAEEGPAQLVAASEDAGAAVVVVGVRLGGQRYLAMDGVAVLLKGSEAGDKAPAVVVVAPSLPRILHQRSWDLGCYDVVSVNEGRDDLPRRIAAAAIAASAWRRGRAVCRALRPPPDPASLSRPRPRRRRRSSQRS